MKSTMNNITFNNFRLPIMREENKRKIIYIAGPMSGYENYNRPAFFDAERELKQECNWIILNPAVHPDGLEHYDYLKMCLPMVEIATHVYMLHGWDKSIGAMIELDHALNHCKTIIFQDDSPDIKKQKKELI